MYVCVCIVYITKSPINSKKIFNYILMKVIYITISLASSKALLILFAWGGEIFWGYFFEGNYPGGIVCGRGKGIFQGKFLHGHFRMGEENFLGGIFSRAINLGELSVEIFHEGGGEISVGRNSPRKNCPRRWFFWGHFPNTSKFKFIFNKFN